jgi:hypothetical protein
VSELLYQHNGTLKEREKRKMCVSREGGKKKYEGWYKK